jgi:hypothetical protein
MGRKKILILVEGHTELGFVKRVLADYFKPIADIIPRINTTKFVKSGPDFKGGVTNYSRMRREILRLLQDSSATIVTTMFDYYGLPKDFPRFNEQAGNCFEKVEFLEQAIQADISNDRFIPYLQLHEFEALLFSEPQAIDRIMVGTLTSSRLQTVRSAFQSPEEINNSPATCPSQRIIGEYPEYEKIFHGQMIFETIGMSTMLRQCNHFSRWIEKITDICTPQNAVNLSNGRLDI